MGWQWGTHGRLYLEWVADNLIAWTSGSNQGRVWRWQRCVPPPRRVHEGAPNDGRTGEGRYSHETGSARGQGGFTEGSRLTEHRESSGYEPWRRPRTGHRVDSTHPYVNRPWSGPPWPPQSHRHARHREHRDRHREHHRHHHRDHREWRSRGLPSEYGGANTRLPCGLTPEEVFDLLCRDI